MAWSITWPARPWYNIPHEHKYGDNDLGGPCWHVGWLLTSCPWGPGTCKRTHTGSWLQWRADGLIRGRHTLSINEIWLFEIWVAPKISNSILDKIGPNYVIFSITFSWQIICVYCLKISFHLWSPTHNTSAMVQVMLWCRIDDKPLPEPVTYTNPESKVHGANTGPTWVLSAPDGPHVGPMNLAITEALWVTTISHHVYRSCTYTSQLPIFVRVVRRRAGFVGTHGMQWEISMVEITTWL